MNRKSEENVLEASAMSYDDVRKEFICLLCKSLESNLCIANHLNEKQHTARLNAFNRAFLILEKQPFCKLCNRKVVWEKVEDHADFHKITPFWEPEDKHQRFFANFLMCKKSLYYCHLCDEVMKNWSDAWSHLEDEDHLKLRQNVGEYKLEKQWDIHCSAWLTQGITPGPENKIECQMCDVTMDPSEGERHTILLGHLRNRLLHWENILERAKEKKLDESSKPPETSQRDERIAPKFLTRSMICNFSIAPDIFSTSTISKAEQVESNKDSYATFSRIDPEVDLGSSSYLKKSRAAEEVRRNFEYLRSDQSWIIQTSHSLLKQLLTQKRRRKWGVMNATKMFYCLLCFEDLSCIEAAEKHFRDESHASSLKKYRPDCVLISQIGRYHCTYCDIKKHDLSEIYDHLMSNRHIKKIAECERLNNGQFEIKLDDNSESGAFLKDDQVSINSSSSSDELSLFDDKSTLFCENPKLSHEKPNEISEPKDRLSLNFPTMNPGPCWEPTTFNWIFRTSTLMHDRLVSPKLYKELAINAETQLFYCLICFDGFSSKKTANEHISSKCHARSVEKYGCDYILMGRTKRYRCECCNREKCDLKRIYEHLLSKGHAKQLSKRDRSKNEQSLLVPAKNKLSKMRSNDNGVLEPFPIGASPPCKEPAPREMESTASREESTLFFEETKTCNNSKSEDQLLSNFLTISSDTASKTTVFQETEKKGDEFLESQITFNGGNVSHSLYQDIDLQDQLSTSSWAQPLSEPCEKSTLFCDGPEPWIADPRDNDEPKEMSSDNIPTISLESALETKVFESSEFDGKDLSWVIKLPNQAYYRVPKFFWKKSTESTEKRLFFCLICLDHLSDVEIVRKHISDERHKNYMKKYGCDRIVIDERGEYHCTCCNRSKQKLDGIYDHLTSDGHAKKLQDSSLQINRQSVLVSAEKKLIHSEEIKRNLEGNSKAKDSLSPNVTTIHRKLQSETKDFRKVKKESGDFEFLEKDLNWVIKISNPLYKAVVPVDVRQKLANNIQEKLFCCLICLDHFSDVEITRKHMSGEQHKYSMKKYGCDRIVVNEKGVYHCTCCNRSKQKLDEIYGHLTSNGHAKKLQESSLQSNRQSVSVSAENESINSEKIKKRNLDGNGKAKDSSPSNVTTIHRELKSETKDFRKVKKESGDFEFLEKDLNWVIKISNPLYKAVVPVDVRQKSANNIQEKLFCCLICLDHFSDVEITRKHMSGEHHKYSMRKYGCDRIVVNERGVYHCTCCNRSKQKLDEIYGHLTSNGHAKKLQESSLQSNRQSVSVSAESKSINSEETKQNLDGSSKAKDSSPSNVTTIHPGLRSESKVFRKVKKESGDFEFLEKDLNWVIKISNPLYKAVVPVDVRQKLANNIQEKLFCCLICLDHFSDVEITRKHMSGEHHKYSMRKYGCDRIVVNERGVYHCTCCNRSKQKLDEIYGHLTSNGHAKKLQESSLQSNRQSVSVSAESKSINSEETKQNLDGSSKAKDSSPSNVTTIHPGLRSESKVFRKVKKESGDFEFLEKDLNWVIRISNPLYKEVVPVDVRQKSASNMQEKIFCCLICLDHFSDVEITRKHMSGEHLKNSMKKYDCNRIVIDERGEYHCTCCSRSKQKLDEIYGLLTSDGHAKKLQESNGQSVPVSAENRSINSEETKKRNVDEISKAKDSSSSNVTTIHRGLKSESKVSRKAKKENNDFEFLEKDLNWVIRISNPLYKEVVPVDVRQKSASNMQEKVFCCLICLDHFSDIEITRKHMSGEHHTNSMKKYGCHWIETTETGNYHCACCNRNKKNLGQIYNHLISRGHVEQHEKHNRRTDDRSAVITAENKSTFSSEKPTFCERIESSEHPRDIELEETSTNDDDVSQPSSKEQFSVSPSPPCDKLRHFVQESTVLRESPGLISPINPGFSSPCVSAQKANKSNEIRTAENDVSQPCHSLSSREDSCNSELNDEITRNFSNISPGSPQGLVNVKTKEMFGLSDEDLNWVVSYPHTLFRSKKFEDSKIDLAVNSKKSKCLVCFAYFNSRTTVKSHISGREHTKSMRTYGCHYIKVTPESKYRCLCCNVNKPNFRAIYWHVMSDVHVKRAWEINRMEEMQFDVELGKSGPKEKGTNDCSSQNFAAIEPSANLKMDNIDFREEDLSWVVSRMHALCVKVFRVRGKKLVKDTGDRLFYCLICQWPEFGSSFDSDAAKIHIESEMHMESMKKYGCTYIWWTKKLTYCCKRCHVQKLDFRDIYRHTMSEEHVKKLRKLDQDEDSNNESELNNLFSSNVYTICQTSKGTAENLGFRETDLRWVVDVSDKSSSEQTFEELDGNSSSNKGDQLFYCYICFASFSDVEIAENHVSSEEHVNWMKKYGCHYVVVTPSLKYHCKCCDRRKNSFDRICTHIMGEEHTTKLRKLDQDEVSNNDSESNNLFSSNVYTICQTSKGTAENLGFRETDLRWVVDVSDKSSSEQTFEELDGNSSSNKRDQVFYCYICFASFSDVEIAENHVSSGEHVNWMKKYGCHYVVVTPSLKYHCKCCDRRKNSFGRICTHIMGEKHAAKLHELNQRKDEPSIAVYAKGVSSEISNGDSIVEQPFDDDSESLSINLPLIEKTSKNESESNSSFSLKAPEIDAGWSVVSTISRTTTEDVERTNESSEIRSTENVVLQPLSKGLKIEDRRSKIKVNNFFCLNVSEIDTKPPLLSKISPTTKQIAENSDFPDNDLQREIDSCQKSFKNPTVKKLNEKASTSPETPVSCCRICSADLLDIEIVRNHILSKENADSPELGYLCTSCNQVRKNFHKTFQQLREVSQEKNEQSIVMNTENESSKIKKNDKIMKQPLDEDSKPALIDLPLTVEASKADNESSRSAAKSRVYDSQSSLAPKACPAVEKTPTNIDFLARNLDWVIGRSHPLFQKRNVKKPSKKLSPITSKEIFHCLICFADFPDAEIARNHISEGEHANSIKRYGSYYIDATSDQKYRCVCCNTSNCNFKTIYAHVIRKRHSYRLQLFEEANRLKGEQSTIVQPAKDDPNKTKPKDCFTANGASFKSSLDWRMENWKFHATQLNWMVSRSHPSFAASFPSKKKKLLQNMMKPMFNCLLCFWPNYGDSFDIEAAEAHILRGEHALSIEKYGCRYVEVCPGFTFDCRCCQRKKKHSFQKIYDHVTGGYHAELVRKFKRPKGERFIDPTGLKALRDEKESSVDSKASSNPKTNAIAKRRAEHLDLFERDSNWVIDSSNKIFNHRRVRKCGETSCKDGQEPLFHCLICREDFPTAEIAKTHISGSTHVNNVDQQGWYFVEVIQIIQYHCVSCDFRTNDLQVLHSHVMSKRHGTRVCEFTRQIDDKLATVCTGSEFCEVESNGKAAELLFLEELDALGKADDWASPNEDLTPSDEKPSAFRKNSDDDSGPNDRVSLNITEIVSTLPENREDQKTNEKFEFLDEDLNWVVGSSHSLYVEPEVVDLREKSAGNVQQLFYCLVCSEHFPSVETAKMHISNEKHEDSIKVFGCHFVKVTAESNYHCTACNQQENGFPEIYEHIMRDAHKDFLIFEVIRKGLPEKKSAIELVADKPSDNKNNGAGQLIPENSESFSTGWPASSEKSLPSDEKTTLTCEASTSSLVIVSCIFVSKKNAKKSFCHICEDGQLPIATKNLEDHINSIRHKLSLMRYGCDNIETREDGSYCACCDCQISNLQEVYLHVKDKKHMSSLIKAKSKSRRLKKVTRKKSPDNSFKLTRKAVLSDFMEKKIEHRDERFDDDLYELVDSSQRYNILPRYTGNIKNDMEKRHSIPGQSNNSKQPLLNSMLVTMSDELTRLSNQIENTKGSASLDKNLSDWSKSRDNSNRCIFKRPESCQICKRTFGNREDLHAHMAKHFSKELVAMKNSRLRKESVEVSVAANNEYSAEFSDPEDFASENRRIDGNISRSINQNSDAQSSLCLNELTEASKFDRSLIKFRDSSSSESDSESGEAESEEIAETSGWNLEQYLTSAMRAKKSKRKMKLKYIMEKLNFRDDDIYQLDDKLSDLILGLRMSMIIDNETIYCLICRVRVSNTLKDYYTHLWSLEHCNYLDVMENDAEQFADFPDQFSDLDLAHEYMVEISDGTVCCYLCNKSVDNENESLRNHIYENEHERARALTRSNALTIYESMKSSLKCDWYGIERYSCFACGTRTESEVAFVKHLKSEKHLKKMLESPNFERKMLLDFCSTCAVLWYGYRSSHCYHVNEVDMHQWLANNGFYLMRDIPKFVQQLLQQPEDWADRTIRHLDAIRLDETAKGEAFVDDLEKIVRVTFPSAKAYTFGSRVTGLSSEDSDIDIFLDCRNVSDGKGTTDTITMYFIFKVYECLSKIPETWDVHEVLTNCRSPIIRAYHRPTGLACDISFDNGLCVEKTKLIKRIVDVYPAFRKLVVILKMWMAYCGLAGSERIAHNTLYWLVIFYLQNETILPSIATLISMKNESKIIAGCEVGVSYDFDRWQRDGSLSIKDLLQRFFKFYANFNFRHDVACPLLGEAIKKRDFVYSENLPKEMNMYVKYMRKSGKPEMLRIDSPMCIQDPFDLPHNVTKAVRKNVLNRFRTCCSKSSDIMASS